MAISPAFQTSMYFAQNTTGNQLPLYLLFLLTPWPDSAHSGKPFREIERYQFNKCQLKRHVFYYQKTAKTCIICLKLELGYSLLYAGRLLLLCCWWTDGLHFRRRLDQVRFRGDLTTPSLNGGFWVNINNPQPPVCVLIDSLSISRLSEVKITHCSVGGGTQWYTNANLYNCLIVVNNSLPSLALRDSQLVLVFNIISGDMENNLTQ